MRLRSASVVVAVGLALPVVGVANPADAAVSTTTTPQCQTLLTCVVPIVTGLTGTVVKTGTAVVGTVPVLVNTVPQLVNNVPQTLSNLLGPNHTAPTGGGTTPPKKPQSGKPTVTKHHRAAPPTAPATTTQVKSTARSVTPTAPQLVQPTVIPPAPQQHPNPVVQVIQQVAHAAEKVVTLFGWNLLALIPMAGIAFVISRRMSAARRSGSSLLPAQASRLIR